MYYIFFHISFIAEFITVGWGKKETQFHGSVGKQAATAKPEVKIDSVVPTTKYPQANRPFIL